LGEVYKLELSVTWIEVTSDTFLLKRRTVYSKDRYEASFLVLAGDPLEDFQNTGRIEMRVREGMFLSVKD
jgi:hypothetical protein